MRLCRLMVALSVGVALLALTSSPASAAAKQWAGSSVSCALTAKITFSRPITNSGGGTHRSSVSASLFGCTEEANPIRPSVEQVTQGTFRGFFARSPLDCATLSAPGAPITGIATWRGYLSSIPVSFRPSNVVSNSVGANGKGNFPGVALVSLNVPTTLASGCATRGGVRSAIVTGTITMGPPCGPGGGSIAIYPISAGSLCGDIYNPSAITTGSDGALWFLNNGSIGRMTTSGAVTLYTGPDIRPSLDSIVAGPDGALWFTNEATSSTSLTGSIGRITTSGVVTVYPTDGGPGGITAGPDGALWFIEGFGFSGRQPLIGRITTSGVITTYAMPSFAGFSSRSASAAIQRADGVS